MPEVRGDFPNVPFSDAPFTHLILEACDKYSHKIALIQDDTGEQLTYKQLRNGILATGSFFHQSGLRKGDVVLVFSTNHIYYPLAWLGIGHIGAMVTTANPLFTKDELMRQIKLTNPKFLITAKAFVPTARQAAKEYEGIKEIFCFDGEAPGCSAFSKVLSADPNKCPNVPVTAEDVFTIPCSSGTTGVPKGVLVPNRALAACLTSISHPSISCFDTNQDVALAVIPLYHIFGMGLFMGVTFFNGVTVVVQKRFELENFFRAFPKHKVTMVIMAPPIAVVMSKHPLTLKTDMSSLKYIMCGAAPLAESVIQELSQRLKHIKVIQLYGMTEVLGVTVAPKAKPVPGSIGKAIPNCIMKVVNIETGKSLGPNQEGEIWVKSPFLMKGYIGNKKATDEFFTSDGFARTGDIGYYDNEGYFYIVDRSKELIKYKGYQVAPAELENTLLSHPSIEDAAVIGLPDEEAGELPFAFVVKKQNAQNLSQKDVIDYVKGKVSPQKHLRGGVEFRESIPKLPSGKILRRILRDDIKKRKQSKL